MGAEAKGLPTRSGHEGGERGVGSRRLVIRLGALAALLLTSGCIPMDNVMMVVFGRSMRDQRSFDPYENTHMPAEGSVPFAAGNYPAQLGQVNVGQPQVAEYDIPPFTAADMARGGAVASGLVNPVPPTPESLARGQLLYNRYCTVCHGPEGLSAQAPIIEKHPVMAAFNLATGASRGQTDGFIYGMIRVGRGVMPPYGDRISHFDRWHIVNYVRQLQAQAGGVAGGGAAPGAPAPAPGAAPGGGA